MSLDVANALAVRARVARLHEGRAVMAHGDAAVERHRDALFGLPVVGETETARRVLVEWVGEPTPLDSPLVMALRARGLLFPDEVRTLRRVALLRAARVDGITSRTLTRERDRMTETVRWGPVLGSYVRSLSFADARRIFDDPGLAHEFRLLADAAAAAGTVVQPDAFWLAAINAMRAAKRLAPVAADHAGLAVRYDREEGLTKIDRAGRVGDWQPYAGR